MNVSFLLFRVHKRHEYKAMLIIQCLVWGSIHISQCLSGSLDLDYIRV